MAGVRRVPAAGPERVAGGGGMAPHRGFGYTRGVMKVVMIPSVAGGIGHISRTSALARALRKLDPSVEVEYLLDTARLRPFNVDATLKMGFRPRFLPDLSRESRDPIVRAVLGDADVIVDDAARYLFPLKHIVPQAAWVSIPMHPVADELFMDWPLMVRMDAVVWAYAPLVGVPPELDIVKEKLLHTGPFLEVEDVPGKAEARASLGFAPDEPLVLYAPRGFPFGQDFGHRVVGSAYRAAEALRASGHPGLRLVLLAVGDRGELRGIEGLPNELPDWVRVEGIVTPAESLLYTRSADILLGEGTSTVHEGAALGTPLVLILAPIEEALRLANGMGERGAAHVFTLPEVTGEVFTDTFRGILERPDEREAMTARARALVTGGGGVAAAAQLVLDVAARRERG